MHLSKLFLFVIAITIFLASLQLVGYQLMESIIIMLIIDFLTLGASMELGKRGNNPTNAIESSITPKLEKLDKLDNIEKSCMDIFHHVTKTDVSNFEDKLKKQSDDISYLLDKMAKKTLELEERVNKFGNGLIDSVSKLSDRVKDLEKTEESEEEKPEESFSLGELVYIDESEEKA
jgi:hypothetical protein